MTAGSIIQSGGPQIGDPCPRSVIPNLEYAYRQGYEPEHLGEREKNWIMERKYTYINSYSLQLQHTRVGILILATPR